MTRSLIVAIAEDGVIGRGNELPWRLPDDLRRFKALTMGHHLVMGRRTFESIGRPLPGRTTVVVSRGRPHLPGEVLLASSVGGALDLAAAAGDTEPFIVGGAEIYRSGLPLVERLYVTRVLGRFIGDVHFPAVDWTTWRLVSQEDRPADDRHPVPFRFEVWDRA